MLAMNWSSEVLYGMLQNAFDLTRVGKAVHMEAFSLPTLLDRDEDKSPGGIYVADAETLSSGIPKHSFVVCVGGCPEGLSLPKSSDVVFVDKEDVSVAEVFNTLQRDIEGLIRWSLKLEDLASEGADVKLLVEASIPVFQNRITIVDYDLRVLAYCEADDNAFPWHVSMHESAYRVPSEVVAPYVDSLKGNRLLRKPFFFEDPVGNNYCVNLYDKDVYLGCCSLTDELHPIMEFETELFQIFSKSVLDALKMQGVRSIEQIATMKTVFTQLVEKRQVSRSQVHDALSLITSQLKTPLDHLCWACIAVGNVNKAHESPGGYVCKTLEEILPRSFAIEHDNEFVVFSLLRSDRSENRYYAQLLERFLNDMNFRAGISRSFNDVFKAHAHYRQAACALDAALEASDSCMWASFDEIALDYMLERCRGEFEQPDLISPELINLANMGPGSIGLDYLDTLRTYLDMECNGIKTAEATFLHRSTLAQRINRIKEVVDLSTPEKRLFIRLCLHLPNVDWKALSRNRPA